MTDLRHVPLLMAARLAAVSLLLIAGCTSIPVATGGAPLTPPPVEVTADPDREAWPTDVSIRYPADNVWAFLASTPGLQDRASSLAEATQFAELVVIGSIDAIERGAAYGAPGEDPVWTAEAIIRVDEVLAGNPSTSESVVVPFVLVVGGDLYPEKEFQDITASIPKGRSVLWLFSWQQYFERSGSDVPDWLKGANRTDRFRLIGGDGFMRIEGDRVVAPGYSTGWPTDVSRTPLAELMESVAAAAAD